jgi:hypothetical protein
MNALPVVPLAVVMVAGPQIISSFFLATSEDPRRTSLAYIAGAGISVAVGTTIVYVVSRVLDLGSEPRGGSVDPIDYVVLVVLVVLAVRTYLGRKDSRPPKWMGKLMTATPRFSFRLGALLFIAMPTDVLTMVTVGTYLARQNLSLAWAIPFFAVTLLFVSLPLLTLLVLGRRADRALPKARAWITGNSWVVSEFVILIFLAISIQGMT